MKKPVQALLGLVAPKRTVAQVRFEQETRRRNGPYEVQGKRYRKKLAEAEEMGEGGWEKMAADLKLPRLRKMS